MSRNNAFFAAHELQSILDHLPGLVSYVDASLYYRFVNRSYEGLLKRARREIVGRPVEAVVGEAFFKTIEPHLKEALAGESVRFEVETSFEARKVWMAMDYIPEKNDLGEVVGILVMGTDISERKASEERLKESEAKYRKLFELAQEGIWIIDADACTTMVNPSMARILGYEKEEMIGKHLFDFMDDEGRRIAERNLERRRKGVEEQHDFVFLKKNGEHIYTALETSPILDAEGNYTGAIAGVIDMTQRRKLEEERDRILNLSMEMICVATMEGMFTYVNPAWTSILGYTQEELCAQPFIELIHEEDRQPTVDQMACLELGESIHGFKNRYIHKDGSIRYLSWNAVPVIQERLVFAMARDITAQVDAEKARRGFEKQMHQAQKMEAIGTLAGGVAHDFNNILSVVIGYTELAMDEAPGNGPLQECLKEVLAATERARSLVKQILTYARREKVGKIPVVVRDAVKEVAKFLRSSLPATIEIETSLLSSSLCHADPTALHQVIMNLGTNAAHAMGGRGVLRLGVCEVGRSGMPSEWSYDGARAVRLYVSDTGCGMAPEVVSRIFDPYFTTKEREEGTGLGLSVVKGIVEQFGGTILVNSAPGQGSCFDIYLPMLEVKERTREPAISGAHCGSGRILCVDDEPAIVSVIKRLLSPLGYEVETCQNGTEALSRLSKDGTFDLLITDLTMPRMTGLELAGRVRTLGYSIPIIVCTGNDIDREKKSGLAVHVTRFLSKPLDRNALSKAVCDILYSRVRGKDA